MAYSKNFENLINKSKTTQAKQADYVKAFNEDKDLLSSIKRRTLAMKDGIVQNGTLSGIMAGLGNLIKQSDTYTVFMNIDSQADDVSVDEATEAKVYSSKVTFIDFENQTDIVLEPGKTYNIKVEPLLDGVVIESINYELKVRETLQNLLFFSNNKTSVTDVGVKTFVIQVKEILPVTASDFVINLTDKTGYEELYTCTLSLYGKVDNVLSKLKTYDKKGTAGYDIWNPDALIEFLDIINVSSKEIANIIAQTIADPKYKKLTNPVEMTFVCTPIDDMSISAKTANMGFYEAAELEVALAKEIIDSITSLEDFRENIKRIIAELDYNSALIIGEHFKFKYEVSANKLTSEAPVIFNTFLHFKESLTITKEVDKVEEVILPQDAYGIRVNSIPLNIDMVQFFHHMYDSTVGPDVVDEIIAKHEKLASEGSFFGITKASLTTGLKKGITNFMNKSIAAAKKKFLAELTSKVDSYKSSAKTKSALSSTSTPSFTTGKETRDTKSYFDNLASSLKDNPEASKSIEETKANIIYTKKVDRSNVSGTPLTTEDELLYKEIKLDGHIELMLPKSDTELFILLYKRSRVPTDTSFQITETKKLLVYNLTTKAIDTTIYETTGTWYENYICIQKDIIKNTDKGVQFLLSDNGIERKCFLYFLNKDASTGYYSLGNIIAIKNYLKYDWAYRVGLETGDKELSANDPETEKISFAIKDYIYLEANNPLDTYTTFILETEVTTDRAEGKNKAIPSVGMVLCQDFKYRYMTLVADSAGFMHIKPLDINLFRSLLNASISTELINRLRRGIGYTYLSNGLKSSHIALYKDPTDVEGLKLTIQDKITDPKESFFIKDKESLRLALIKSFDLSNSIYKEAANPVINVDVVDTHLPDVKENTEIYFNYSEKSIFYISKDILENKKIARNIVKYNYKEYAKLKEYTTYGENLIGGNLYGTNADLIGYDTNDVDNIYKGVDLDITLNKTDYKITSRGTSDRTVAIPSAEELKTSSYILTDGSNKLNSVVTSHTNVEKTTDTSNSSAKDKIKEILNDTKTDTSIKITIKLPSEPKRTITCKDITLEETANLQAAVEAQQEMFQDILNEFTEAKEKINKAKNKHKKYTVTNYLPKQ